MYRELAPKEGSDIEEQTEAQKLATKAQRASRRALLWSTVAVVVNIANVGLQFGRLAMKYGGWLGVALALFGASVVGLGLSVVLWSMRRQRR